MLRPPDDGSVVVVGKTEPLGRAATYKDLCQVPDHLIAEILEGDLWASPRPGMRHSHAAAMLSAEIMGPFGQGRGGPGGWWILFEPEVHLRDDVVVPDVAAWRRDGLKKPVTEAYMTQPPDWVCEIVSPSTEHVDRKLKLKIYAREGVGYLWLIDPIARALEVLRLDHRTWVPVATLHDDAVAEVEPFAAVRFPLTRIWLEI